MFDLCDDFRKGHKVEALTQDLLQSKANASNLRKQRDRLQTSLAEAQKVIAKVAEEGGSLLDPYRLYHADIIFSETKLGEGAFGTVFKAEFRGKVVAVKTVSRHRPRPS